MSSGGVRRSCSFSGSHMDFGAGGGALDARLSGSHELGGGKVRGWGCTCWCLNF